MIGKKIQNYEIRSHLGEGGMGTVYKATDSILGREVALKMLHAPLLQQTQFLERFKKEARLLAQLLHPNIAVIYNLIEQDQNQYMVMEYVEGKNLEALLKQHRTLSYKLVVPVFLQALEGLRHAHKKGIYHRDIKPSNLILTPDGTVKLMDFGIAMMAGEKRMTQVNRVVGTIEYMAPELIEGKEPSMASDIYAMGITMYEMLTGKLPFEGNTDFNLMQDILKKKPVAPEKMNASVPKALNNIVMKALEKKPENRFADAKEFAQALTAAFPELKFTDLSAAYQPPATQVVQISNYRNAAKPTVEIGSTTRPLNKYLATVASLKTSALKKENRIYLIALGVVLLVSIAILVIAGMDSDGHPKLVASNQDKKDSTTYMPEKKDQPNDNDRRGGDNGFRRQVIGPHGPLRPDSVSVEKEKQPGEEEKQKKPEEKKPDQKKVEDKDNKNKKEKEKQVEKKDSVKKQDPPPVEEKKQEVKPKPEEKKEAKTVRINSAMEVDLYLREPLSASAQEGQSLQFSVTTAVRYNGDVIIEKGALATGRIKNVGNKKISIVISRVKAANGEMIPLQEVELSGRIADMVSNRSYSVPLKKGTIIQL
jgi:serine/threonine-protein kinase